MKSDVDFLGIGAHKSATTWLDINLRRHPEIWMPPVKELHYFDRSAHYKTAGRQLLKKSRLKSYIMSKIKNRKYLGLLKEMLKNPNNIFWYYQYLNFPVNDNWYLSLFKYGGIKIKGEITPTYSILDEEDVKKVKALIPDLKIIFLLRNPIDRYWSAIRSHWTKHPSFNINSIKDVLEFINSSNTNNRINYLKTINIWTKYFSKENIFIGYYDDVKNSPEKLFKDILSFLEADQSFLPETLNKKIHISNKFEIPDEIKFYLAQKYHQQLRELAKTLGGYSKNWLKDAECILNNAPDSKFKSNINNFLK